MSDFYYDAITVNGKDLTLGGSASSLYTIAAPDGTTIIVSGNPTKWTKRATLRAVYSDGSPSYMWYSVDGGDTWNHSTSGVVGVTKNCVVCFSISNKYYGPTTFVNVTKVDSVAPLIGVAGNPHAWTTSAKLKANFFDELSGIKTREYSLDGQNWKKYTSPITVKSNGKIYFRASDNAGNIGSTVVNVTKIDSGAPGISIQGNPTKWTKSAILSATFFDNLSGIKKKQYSLDGGKTWKTYTSEITIKKNGTYYFKATDNAGHTCKKSVKVTKIDTVAPTIKVSGNPKSWAKSAKLTATFKDNLSGVRSKLYSFDGQNWKKYTSPITVSWNCTIYFRAIDNADNLKVTSVKVTKLDVSAPTISVSGNPTKWTKSAKLTATFKDDLSGVKPVSYYSLDGANWKHYSAPITVTKNCTVYFKASDYAGWSVNKSVKVTKVDSVAPTIKVSGNPTGWTSQATLTAKFSDNLSGIKSKQYSTDNKTWKSYSGAITVKSNGTWYFKATDNAGNTTTQSVRVTKIRKNDNANDTWKNAEKLSSSSVSDWVGRNDLADYYKFSVSKKENLKFDLDTATADAVQNGDLKVKCLTSSGKNVSLVWDGADFATKSKVAAGTYILGVTDPVGNKKGLDYKIAILK